MIALRVSCVPTPTLPLVDFCSLTQPTAFNKGAGAPPPLVLHHLTHLVRIDIVGFSNSDPFTGSEAGEVVLEQLLSSWRPSTSTRHLSIAVTLRQTIPRRKRQELLHLVAEIGGAVKKHCSGARSTVARSHPLALLTRALRASAGNAPRTVVQIRIPNVRERVFMSDEAQMEELMDEVRAFFPTAAPNVQITFESASDPYACLIVTAGLTSDEQNSKGLRR